MTVDSITNPYMIRWFAFEVKEIIKSSYSINLACREFKETTNFDNSFFGYKTPLFLYFFKNSYFFGNAFLLKTISMINPVLIAMSATLKTGSKNVKNLPPK